MRFVVVKVALGENFPPSHYHSHNVPYSLFSSYYFDQKDDRPKPGNLPIKHGSFGRR